MGNTCSLHTADGDQSCHSTVNCMHGSEGKKKSEREGLVTRWRKIKAQGEELVVTGFGGLALNIHSGPPQLVHHVLAEE